VCSFRSFLKRISKVMISCISYVIYALHTCSYILMDSLSLHLFIHMLKLQHYIKRTILFFLIRIVGGGGGVQTGSIRRVSHYCPIVPAPGDCVDGEFGGIKIGRGIRSTRRNPTPASLCPPQIPLDQTRARTRTATVGSQRLATQA
jgi:hypothetical protein